MKLAYTVWTWMLEEYAPDAPTSMGKPHFEEAVKSISYLGYRYIENFNFIVPMYEDNPQELLDLLKDNHLELVNLYHLSSSSIAAHAPVFVIPISVTPTTFFAGFTRTPPPA